MSKEIKNNLEQRVRNHFFDSIETKKKAAETMSEDIVRAINLIHHALTSEKKNIGLRQWRLSSRCSALCC